MTCTVISHFFNEAFLLPFWLRHHRTIFDHGILIDYASTDASVEICRDMAPQWEVRPSRNCEFDAENVDDEVKSIEREVTGWKMALTTTEFLVAPELSAVVRSSGGATAECIGLDSVVLVDPRAAYGRPIDSNVSLVAQCPWGYIDRAHDMRRRRFLHSHPDGGYHLGRHDTHHPYRFEAESFIVWFGWAPYYQVRARKLQIQTRMSQRDRQLGLGFHHIVSEEQLDARWESQSKLSGDLRVDEHYWQAVARCLAVGHG